MSITVGDIRELLGEHEGIRAHMRFLTRSQKEFLTRDIQAKEKIWAYRFGLHDFKEEIQLHIEVDKRIFSALAEDISINAPVEEHEEILNLFNELIELADSAAIDRFSEQELSEYSEKIGSAVNKICDLVEIHIITENKILEKALEKLCTATN